MLVKDLDGNDLKYFIAKAEGRKLEKRDGDWFICNDAGDWMFEVEFYVPRIDSILEKGAITFGPFPFVRDENGIFRDGWSAFAAKSSTSFTGLTPSVAIYRAFVASVFGDEVESIKED